MAELNVADVGQLKSGGVKMSEAQLHSNAGADCAWAEYGDMFDGIRPQRVGPGRSHEDILSKSGASGIVWQPESAVARRTQGFKQRLTACLTSGVGRPYSGVV